MMETEILSAGVLEETALQQLLKESFLLDGLFLGERVPSGMMTEAQRRDLLYFARYNDNIAFTSYTSGRIFQRAFELRWEKRGSAWQVVYLGAQRALPLLDRTPETALEAPRTAWHYLFGKPVRKDQIRGIPDDANFFAEARIPRLLHYRPAPPVEEKRERVCLEVYEYLDPTGQVQAFRFVDLKRAE